MASRMETSEGQLPPEVLQRVIRLQILTILWMSTEVGVALGAAWAARSPALLGFGGDSAVELFSAIVVLWRFRWASDSSQSERLAARIAGGLLFAVGGFVVVTSGLSFFGFREAHPSILGIAILIVAAISMPLLASRKRKLAAQVGSAVLRADASESALCGYLSLIALAGLLANAIFHVPWADPLAALALVPFIAKEGWEAIRAARLCDCSSI